MFYLWFFALVAMATPLSTGNKVTEYQNSLEYTVTDVQPTNETVYQRSKLECAKFCAMNAHCLTFNFNKTTMMCHWSNEVINTEKGHVYGPRDLAVKYCPVQLGYTIYGRDGVHLCLKLVAMLETHDTAQSKCQNDGGHLIQIKSDKEHLLIKEVLNPRHVAEGFWADGKGRVGKTFFGWDGEKVPWLKWGAREPNRSGVQCLRLKQDVDYLFSDNDCSNPRPYVCEMD